MRCTVERAVFRYRFNAGVLVEEAESALALAITAAECLFGAAEVRLSARYLMKKRKRTCVVDASTTPGHAVNRFFVGFLNRAIGETAYEVDRVRSVEPTGVAA